MSEINFCQHGIATYRRCRRCDERSEMMALSQKDRKPGTETVENPKHFTGLKKVLMSCIPWPVIWELGVAMLEGALKYGRHNYRAAGQIRASTYFDGTMRHMTAWWEGEDTDPDSGLSHITKAIASNVVLRDAMIRGNFVDDRPPHTDAKVFADLNDRSLALMQKYPNPVLPYTQVDFSWAQAAGQAAALQRDVQVNDEGDGV